MAKLEVPPVNRFAQQAQIHLDIQGALQDLVTQFNTQHDTIVSKLDPKQAAQYTQWWNNLSKCIGQHADLHEQLALHLNNAGQVYHQEDSNISTVFTPKP